MQRQGADKKQRDKDVRKDKRKSRFSSIGKMFGKSKEKHAQRSSPPHKTAT